MICNSGGAQGADMAFERACVKKGITVRAYSFQGHKTESQNKIILTETQLLEGHQSLLVANETLKRWYPGKPWVNNLLRRNYYQIKDAQAVFAIAQIDQKGWKVVDGGTGWAVEMAKNFKIPVFVFDQNLKHWYNWCFEAQEWEVINLDSIPKYEIFAGIGSRDLTQEGETEINRLIDHLTKS
jgi:hypothetical protein